jgi:hypothetical protein
MEVKTKITLTIWHAVMEHATVTFLTYDALKDFLGPDGMGDITTNVVVCDSEISPEDYNRLSAMRGEV